MFFEERSSSRNDHLILWLLEILTDQQKLYDTKLVMQKKRYYHPLNVLLEIGHIASFVLNC